MKRNTQNATKGNNIESKLKSYTALAAGVIAIGSNADAQVIYTDLNPDVTIGNNGTYQLNLDGDTAIDYALGQSSYNSSGNNLQAIYASGNFNNKILINKQPLSFTSTSAYLVLALNANDPINNSQVIWESYGMMNIQGVYNSIPINLGNWQGVTDKYVGLQFQIGGQLHFGWARLDVNPGATQFIIKDYAYELTPNKEILAGQTVTDIKKSDLPENISVYTHNKTLFVNFKENNTENSIIKLYNLQGQEIKSVNADNNQMKINVDDVNAGIYLVNVYDGKGIFTKKVNIK